MTRPSSKTIPSVTLNNGVQMPALGLGLACWNVQQGGIAHNPKFKGMLPEQAFVSLERALQAGLRMIDTALVYRTHTVIRQVLGEWFRGQQLKREDLFITTKVYHFDNFMGTRGTTVPMDQMTPDQVTDHVTEQVEQSLEELGLGYLDLVLLHWPSKPGNDDPDTNRKRRLAAWKVLEAFYKQGWIRAIGVSNFSERHLTQLVQDGGEITPAVNQIEASVFLQWDTIVKYCHEHDIQVQAFSPLGHGDSNVVDNPVVTDIAGRHEKNEGQVAMRYLIQKGYAIVFSSSSSKRLRSNQDIFDGMELSSEDMKALDGLIGTAQSTGQPSPYILA